VRWDNHYYNDSNHYEHHHEHYNDSNHYNDSDTIVATQ